jgi:hypothetical protein
MKFGVITGLWAVQAGEILEEKIQTARKAVATAV